MAEVDLDALVKCPVCHGHGSFTVMSGWDQGDNTHVECNRCNKTGKVRLGDLIEPLEPVRPQSQEQQG